MVKHRFSSTALRLVVTGLAVVALVGTLGTVSASASAPAAPKASISLGDNFFQPTSLVVVRGTKVTWTWTGANTHNVTVIGGPQKFHSTNQSSGSFSHTMTKVGTYHIICTFHPGMEMTLKVKKAPGPAPTTTTS